MQLLERYLAPTIGEDLVRKMVFIGGPRQVGKTTLAKMIGEDYERPAYLNWDRRSHRLAMLRGQWSPQSDLLVFDELHKYPRWKSLIKGFWDTREPHQRFLVTGSSRLNVFRRGGDSLQGRYHYHRLHPFTLAELEGGIPGREFAAEPPALAIGQTGGQLDALMRFGGFPEPLLAQRERTLRRWQRERFDRVFREDIRELEAVRSLAQVELLGQMLEPRVARTLAVSSFAEDLDVSPKTVKSWLELLCRNYYTLRIPPYHRRLDRALKKESKYYLWDWSEVRDEGRRFENLVAVHLLKFCHYHEDAFGIPAELYYIRDREKREVDFLVVWDGTPWLAVECKLQAPRRATHLRYFADKLNVAQRYVVTLQGDDYLERTSGVRFVPASRFLMALI